MTPQFPEERDHVQDVAIKQTAESTLKKQELACLT